jgi:hypothetical protein
MGPGIHAVAALMFPAVDDELEFAGHSGDEGGARHGSSAILLAIQFG